jgi:outer membrane scaffolding protein for murein synthesis (MipA/OmpV family)
MNLLRALSLLLLAGLSLPAFAQNPSPLAEWEYSAGQALEPYFVTEVPEWQRLVGLVVEGMPRYEGARGYHLAPGMIFDLRYKDVAFASVSEGFGVNLLHRKGERAGLAITYDVGRDTDQDGRLRGLGDIRPAPELKAFEEYVIFPVVLRGTVRETFGGHGGLTGTLSAYMPVMGSEKFFLMVGPEVTFADGHNQRNTFGVSPEQSARSGYPVYRPGGGLRDARFGASATWIIHESWMIDLTGACEWLVGSAEDNPFAREMRQYALSLSAGYMW